MTSLTTVLEEKKSEGEWGPRLSPQTGIPLNTMGPPIPFPVDCFPPGSRTFFLTHAHKDHLGDVRAGTHITGAFGTVYCTEVTQLLVLARFPALARRASLAWVLLDYHEPVRVVGDGGENARVTALDAGHCAGSAMFLFDTDAGNVLHTGDARLTEEVVDAVLDALEGQPLHGLHCDATFGGVEAPLPSVETSVLRFQSLVASVPRAARVYIAADTLGTEPILECVVDEFGQRVWLPRAVDSFGFGSAALVEERRRELQAIAPEVLTADPATTRFVLCGGRDVQQHAAAIHAVERLAGRAPPLIVRPSAMEFLFAKDTQPVVLKNQVHYVMFARHSSRHELIAALERLKPGCVVGMYGEMPNPM